MSAGLLAAAPAAPILPAISTLGAVLAFALAFALSVMWFQILRGPLVRLAKVGVLRVHPFGWLAGVVSNVDRWLNATVAGTERALTWSFHSLMWSLSTTAQLTADLAQATYEGINWWKRHTTRHVGAQTGQSITPRVKTLEREYKNVAARLGQIEHREKAQSRAIGDIAGELHGLEHAATHAGAKAVPGAHAIPRTAPRVVPRARAGGQTWTIPGLERLLRDRGRTRQRLHEIEKKLTIVGFAGLMVAALSRMGMGWMRCPSLLRMGKRIGCGGFGWLEGFFATAFEAMVVLDLCKFALAAQRLARLIVPQLAGTLLVQNAVCLGGGASYPSAHDSPKTLTRVTLPSAHD